MELDEVSFEMGELKGRVGNFENDLTEVKADVKTLLAIANKGKGAWLAILKIGGALAAIGGALVILGQGIGWIYDHLVHFGR